MCWTNPGLKGTDKYINLYQFFMNKLQSVTYPAVVFLSKTKIKNKHDFNSLNTTVLSVTADVSLSNMSNSEIHFHGSDGSLFILVR